jgi:ATP-binding cassette, subfamily B (MDR/TAP), member 7
MDLGFHLSRQTGGLSRAIDRGTKGISSMLTWIVFHIAPTLLEIGMVSGILVSSNDIYLMCKGYKFGWQYAGVAVATMGMYILFTVRTTSWRYALFLMLLIPGRNFESKRMQQTIKQQRS